MIGQRFGKILVLKDTGKRKYQANSIVWLCQCDCGEVFERTTIVLKRKKHPNKSCGKCRHMLEGKRFGRLLVIAKTEKRKDGAVLWECICDCGKKRLTGTRELNKGRVRSCGCLIIDSVRKNGQAHKVDLSGKVFGRLTVIGESAERKHKKVMWNCKCECGNETIAYGQDLRRGKSKSCGCLHNEMLYKNK